ncbi:MAG: recombinase RmuC [Stygiobacter sp. RIFOXYC12_FULL_38_8]|nr:MAG: recombinase RmuC [Stygiobacter sp. RIFOXYA12_FULL_38_9]OGV09550.1 MAG: recombinase RmuC [Stygiobacter sp. RIFOXYB2_FULL_37_11]OGV13924.1 MAG: recombinase RmuC [Stygiobacter sp. RIFOXYC2_FULL_38_25]OGV15416.1 MAG: recombinase RmuC [Stygiobacter sp. RIFOXYA2_FULL_38_8]OGV22189.1 MAG: recombinase RmuC [Stygiobacter sp. RIFOXYC12_FULL_38_8]OGV82630.1 MAG: recombinase RmuC [Stygiobacter sp. GWF2_38_21]OGV99493.1 MAG: recombinase RmuC [Melioribacter sp. RIFOXYB12_FULL_38_5]RJQ62161.1 MAG: 
MNELVIFGLILIALAIVVVFFILNKKLSLLGSGNNQDDFARLDKSFRDEIARTRDESSRNAKAQREELNESILKLGEQLTNTIGEISKRQKDQLDIFSKQINTLTQSNEQKLDKLQEKVESQLKEIQDKNEKKLEEMRQTVDEKLHETLEKRLGESFKLVSDRLEAVREGLGEMRNLAVGVGDLKKVLTNVKTRGTWGEIQLENLIEQILSRDQYEKNVATKKGSGDRVEFAIKMPGRSENKDGTCWLPVDAKFPMEDYQRLLAAQELGDIVLIEETSKALEARIRGEAKSIFDKYIDPPNTTDVAILFLPIEGLFAEVLRRPGLFERLQNDYKVIIAGPTTLTAILNSLHMGFRTLAIEKRSSEVWSLLGAVKAEFGKFGDVLEKTQKKLQEASNTIEDASKRTRVIERKLKSVETNSADEQTNLIEE